MEMGNDSLMAVQSFLLGSEKIVELDKGDHCTTL